MSTKLNLWRARELTLYGKSLLAKTLGASQLIYTASMICVPDIVINNVQGHLSSFLQNNRKDKIKRKVIYQPLSEFSNDGKISTSRSCLDTKATNKFL